ncbi:MAG: PTS sugar transporter subunit IIA [Planctomycetota bacterium]|jgi:mannitol/fructose-specific phosphotransferase system IIA component (Ntr-type)
MKFADFVCFEAVTAQLEVADRDGVIAELVSALDKAGRLGNKNCQKIIKAVIKRENEASTGMGKGVAVPHVKHEAVKDVVAVVGLSGGGIDFSSLDKQPVFSAGYIPQVPETMPESRTNRGPAAGSRRKPIIVMIWYI